MTQLGEDTAHQNRSLLVLDAAGKRAAAVGASAAGRGLAAFDAGGRVVVRLGEDASHTCRGLGIQNPAGQYVAGLTSGPAHGELTLSANNGSTLIRQPPP